MKSSRLALGIGIGMILSLGSANGSFASKPPDAKPGNEIVVSWERKGSQWRMIIQGVGRSALLSLLCDPPAPPPAEPDKMGPKQDPSEACDSENCEKPEGNEVPSSPQQPPFPESAPSDSSNPSEKREVTDEGSGDESKTPSASALPRAEDSEEEFQVVSKSRGEDAPENSWESDFQQAFHWPKLIPKEHPAWLTQGPEVDGSTHYVPIHGLPDASFQQSLESLNERVLQEAQKYLDNYVLDHDGAAEQLPLLTEDWVKKHWLEADKRFDASMDTPSGSYRLAWTRLRIPESDRKLIKSWWEDRDRQEHVKRAAGLTAVGLLGLSLIHFAIGFTRPRSKN